MLEHWLTPRFVYGRGGGMGGAMCGRGGAWVGLCVVGKGHVVGLLW